MKFAICNETFPEWSFEKTCLFSKECGYTGIEIAPFTLAKYATQVSSTTRAELRSTAQKSGLEIIGLHWLLAQTEGFYLTTPDSNVREATAEYLCELARLCHDLGGHIMVLGSPKQRNLLPGVSHEEAMGFAADTLRRVIPVLERLDVTLALEPLGPEEGDFMRTAAVGEKLMRSLGSVNCRLHLDVKAMSTESLPSPEIIRKHAPHTAHFHANDPNRRGPGMGDVDFTPILGALQETAYKGWVSVEVFDYTPGPERLASESIRYMEKIMKSISK